MVDAVPVTVGIPTWARGERVFKTLERIYACNPPPAEIIVHVDAGDGSLEKKLTHCFPRVRVLSSERRVGPGGGRHRCIHAGDQPYFVSFDDDSYPLDGDFFAEVVRLFSDHEDTALLAAQITHPWETAAPKTSRSEPAVEFTGCGWAVRRDIYLACAGFVDRPYAYGIEELDLGLQLHAAGLAVRRVSSLRVYHDTALSHHRNPRQTSAAVQNVALLAWLRYPWPLAGFALLQVANMTVDQLRRGRWRGVPMGLLAIPSVLWAFRRLRRPLPLEKVRSYLVGRCIPVERAMKLKEAGA